MRVFVDRRPIFQLSTVCSVIGLATFRTACSEEGFPLIASCLRDKIPYTFEMGESTRVLRPAAPIAASANTLRHSATIRVAHWVTVLCFGALLVSGVEIVISHPRFYWGEDGNVGTPALFAFSIPASRSSVPTGYNYVLPDQNGWSRSLHFQSAWALLLTGLIYVISGLFTRHFSRNLFPGRADLSCRLLVREIAKHLRFKKPDEADAWSYNMLQRLTYLGVIFGLFPLVIWTGLAMSPAFVSAVPFIVIVLGGQQSARTLHFFASVSLVLFLLVHITMVFLAGFKRRMCAMITGRIALPREPL